MPEVILHVADEPYGPWEAVERRAGAGPAPGTPPPFWAFPWAGGVALARHLLDHPDVVGGRTVVDLGCGSGLVALAALRAGARHVTAVDVDSLALVAVRLNAGLAGVRVGAPPEGALTPVPGDVLAAATDDDDPLRRTLGRSDVVLAGDLFFERSLAAATLAVLRRAAADGADVLVGDPGRAHLPADAFTAVAGYDVPVPAALEDRAVRHTRVLRLRR